MPRELLNTIVGACYRLLRPLGEGGMGTVYEAQHLRLGTKLAIKVLSPQFAKDPKFRDRFKREAKAASQIRHPNVVQITDFGETPSGSVFFAMELLEGRDLHAVLRAHAPAPFPWPRALHILAQATDALAAAHRCGIVHRDVKPANIFVLEGPGVNDFVKLLDFGIAKLLAPTPSADSALVKNLTGTGEIFGTAKYMAPEQAYGSSDDPRVDVYSLGVVAYELLTGRVPFTGESSFEIITRHVYTPPQPLRELRPDLPAALQAVVMRALEKQPENRFATMEELGQALRTITEPAAPRSGAAGSPGRVVSAAVNTDAHTVPRRGKSEHPSVEPTTALRLPVPAPTAGLAPFAAPSPEVEARPFRGQTLQAPSAQPVALPVPAPSAPSPTQRTTNLPLAEAGTGPLARRNGTAYDDTGRDVGMRPAAVSVGSWRFVSVAVLGAVVVGALSATGVFLAVGSGTDAPPSVVEPAPTQEPIATNDLAPVRVQVPRSEVEPAVDMPSPTLAADASTGDGGTAALEATDDTGVAALPPPDLGTTPTAVPASRRSDEPLQEDPEDRPRLAKPANPSNSPPQPGKSDDDLGKEVMAKVKAWCQVSKEQVISIELQVDRQGKVTKVKTSGDDALKSCVERLTHKSRFSGKEDVVMPRVLIKSCLDPFNDKPKCS